MIVGRGINTVKEGRLEEFVEFAKWWNQRFPPPHASRLYLPIEGASSNVIVLEEEYESKSERQSHVERVLNDPDYESASTKFRELLDDSQFGLWEVIELK